MSHSGAKMTYKAMQLVSVTLAILLFLSALGNAQNPPPPPAQNPPPPPAQIPPLPTQIPPLPTQIPPRPPGVPPTIPGATKPPAVTPPATLTLPTITRVDVIARMPRAKVCSTDSKVCMTVTDLGEAFDVMAEFPEDAKWGAVGWGTAMPQSDIVLGYKLPTNNQFIVSDRKAIGRSPAPVDQQQDALAIRGGAGVMPGKWLMEFQRKKDTGDINDAVVDLSKKVSMIWAYHATTPPNITKSGDNSEFRATITKHTNTGALTLDMQDEAQVKSAKEAGLSGTASNTGTKSNSSVMQFPSALPTLGTVLFMSAVIILA